MCCRMAGFLNCSFVILVLFAYHISHSQCKQEEKVLKVPLKVLNDGDRFRYDGCRSLMKAGYNISGVYRLTLNVTDLLVPCEFRDGNAFAVILRRWSNSVSFIQRWPAYVSGFGDPQGNYWAGLANIYLLTQSGNTNLQINMQDWTGQSENALYSGFYLEPLQTRHRMHVATYRGTLPDELSYNNNMPFATFDIPNVNDCAQKLQAGWWYNNCAHTLPTGTYYYGGWYTPSSVNDGIYWKDWYGYNYSLKFISMTLSS